MLILYDADNFYYCAAHNFASPVDQDLDIPLTSIICCLKEIQEMKFYLRIGFGDSKVSYSRTMIRPFQVLFRVNGGSPAGWFLISFILIIYLK